MRPTDPANTPAFQDKAFLFLVVAVSLAFAWILWPFFGAVLWGVIIAIMFAPLYRRLSRSMGQRRTLAALSTELIVLVLVILPVTLIAALLVQEALGMYQRIQSGDLDFGRLFQRVLDALPTWVTALLERVGLSNLGAVRERVSAGLTQGIQFLASQAINLGQNTFDFIVSLFAMLYLLFFLLRDGDQLAGRINRAIPLPPAQKRDLAGRFTTVIRATVKGNVVVAVVQGALGAFIFWILGIHGAVLWGALMALLSLLPAVGAGLVWVPVAVYLLVTGSVWKGIVLTAFGVLVIGLVDNLLRPILVGKDTKIPDYIILISTLGGIAIFGFNGFVIGPLIAAMFITVWDIFAASRSAAGMEGVE